MATKNEVVQDAEIKLNVDQVNPSLNPSHIKT
jgi:hypothetical protein